MDTTTNKAPNLPVNTNVHKVMEANHSSVLSNVANTSKRFFRFTLDTIERVIKRILGKDITGASSIQKAISVRTASATYMLNNASLPLDGNKNLRAHRASLKDMLDIHPDAIAVSLFVFNQRIALNTKYSHGYELTEDQKKKCVCYHQGGSSPYTFKEVDEVSILVNCMMKSIIEEKEHEIIHNEKIKIIIEAPPFVVSGDKEFTDTDCAKEYITACEAWQVYLQGEYGKEVTILPFRAPENKQNRRHKEFTTKNNNAYNSTNAELAKMNKKDREGELSGYVASIYTGGR